MGDAAGIRAGAARRTGQPCRPRRRPTLLFRADAWNHVEPVFCGRIGPDGEVRMDVTGHPGFHSAAGLGGPCWGEGDSSG
ncbi:hypothetical protein [Micromonospora sp. NBC_00421]|uniref:hypothetical protein n=1 Tax=Micromonospora sp. NBC_00421 TaxID=2975976 RepID=UPI002E1EE425